MGRDIGCNDLLHCINYHNVCFQFRNGTLGPVHQLCNLSLFEKELFIY